MSTTDRLRTTQERLTHTELLEQFRHSESMEELTKVLHDLTDVLCDVLDVLIGMVERVEREATARGAGDGK